MTDDEIVEAMARAICAENGVPDELWSSEAPAARAALAVATAAYEWQPIETAPKDGTELLIAWADSVTSYQVAAARWNGQTWTNTYTAFSRVEPPTHWRPLPSPPRNNR